MKSDDYDDFEDLSADLESNELPVESNDVKSKQPNSGNKISVYFQSTVGPSQRQEKMVVTLDAPVSELKYTISQIFGLPHDEFHLSHAGRTLDPDDILSNYEIESGDTLLLIPISIAGYY